MGIEQSDNKKVLLNLIKSAISGEVIVETKDLDWKWVYTVSCAHSLCGLVAYAIDKLEHKPPQQIVAVFDNARNVGIVRESKQQVEADIIFDMMEAEGVINMPMKGFITKNLYPSPDMRSMCDVDILIKDGFMDKAERIMQELKYPIREGGGREVVYKRPPLISFELHRSFVSEKYQKIVFDYYRQIWDKAKLVDGKKFSYQLTNEDFYIYMIVHIAKHYLSGGIGIRAILDVYVFLEHYKGVLDREYIKSEFNKIKLLSFADNIEKMSYVWFADGECDDITANMTDFIFQSGTYGSKLYGDAAYALRDGQSGGRHTGLKRFANALFLPYDNMCELYPALKKRPWMLVFYWFYRIFDRLLNDREKVKRSMKYTAEEKDVNLLENHLKKIGLM